MQVRSAPCLLARSANECASVSNFEPRRLVCTLTAERAVYAFGRELLDTKRVGDAR
jgi:hypothetical protein